MEDGAWCAAAKRHPLCCSPTIRPSPHAFFTLFPMQMHVLVLFSCPPSPFQASLDFLDELASFAKSPEDRAQWGRVVSQVLWVRDHPLTQTNQLRSQHRTAQHRTAQHRTAQPRCHSCTLSVTRQLLPPSPSALHPGCAALGLRPSPDQRQGRGRRETSMPQCPGMRRSSPLFPAAGTFCVPPSVSLPLCSAYLCTWSKSCSAER